jgi:hypothetical protein
VSFEEDQAVFPDEHLGNEYALNWAISNYNMTATGQAFHNLHPRGLTMLTEGALDGNKAVVQSVDAKGKSQVVVVDSGLSDAAFGQLVRRAREELTHAENLFVHDGALGLVSEAGPTVRSFTSEAATGLMLNNLLRSFRLPLTGQNGEELEQWRQTLPEELRDNQEETARLVRLGQLESPAVRDPHTLTQFLLPNLEGVSSELAGKDFSVIDAKRRIIVHSGNNVNAASVRAGLLQLASVAECWDPAAVVVAADTFLTEAGPVMVFGGGQWGTTAPWAAHDTVWTGKDTLVPVWYSGAQEGATTQFGDYVEQTGKTQVVVGPRRGPHEAFEAAAPAAILFVEAGSKKAVKINPEQARKKGLPDALVERITKSKVGLFTVPPPSGDAQQWITKIIK